MTRGSRAAVRSRTLAGTVAVALAVMAAVASSTGNAIGSSRSLSARGNCVLTWSVLIERGFPFGQFYSVAADASDDAWAVGGPAQVDGPRHRQVPALTLHWNGSSWQSVSNPLTSAVLNGVAADARDDAWAVGERAGTYGVDEQGAGAVAAHWDGNLWRRVALPRLQRLSAVAATSKRDVWAVGVDRRGRSVVIHWNGTSWQLQRRSSETEFHDVSALAPGDVWVAGDRPTTPGGQYVEAHWDGRRWTTYRQPPPTDGKYGVDYDTHLRTITALTTHDVWAAGDAGQAGDPAYRNTVLFHWTGARWQKLAVPDDQWVDDLAARTAGDLWLASSQGHGDAYGEAKIWRHLTGTAWSPASLPNDDEAVSLSSDNAGGLWAVGRVVGSYDAGLGNPHSADPLIAHGRCT